MDRSANGLGRHLVVALMAVMLVLTGCAGSQSTAAGGSEQKAPAKIRVVGPGSPPSMPFLRMIETNAMGDTQIEFTKWTTADQLTAAVTGGSEFVAAPLTTGAALAHGGADLQLLNVSAWAVMGLVTTDESIKSVDDLRGKEIHVAMRASAVDYTMQLVLANHGLSDSVKVTYVDASSGPEQFLAGKIATMVTVEPQVTLLTTKNPKARSVVDFAAEWKQLTHSDLPLPTAGTFVNGKFAKEHPDTAKKFQQAYAEAAAWVAANPGPAGELAGKNLGLPAPVVTAAIPKISWQAQTAQEAKPAVNLYFSELFKRWPESVGGELPKDSFYLQ